MDGSEQRFWLTELGSGDSADTFREFQLLARLWAQRFWGFCRFSLLLLIFSTFFAVFWVMRFQWEINDMWWDFTWGWEMVRFRSNVMWCLGMIWIVDVGLWCCFCFTPYKFWEWWHEHSFQNWSESVGSRPVLQLSIPQINLVIHIGPNMIVHPLAPAEILHIHIITTCMYRFSINRTAAVASWLNLIVAWVH